VSDLTELQALKSDIIARMREVMKEKKPSYKTATGQSVDWKGYMTELRQQLADVNVNIVSEDPYAEETQVVTPDDPLFQ